jgi:outer membrane lipoprotein-sorting protein
MSVPQMKPLVLLAVIVSLTGCRDAARQPSSTTSKGQEQAALEVLQKMRAVYRNAKSYTDNSSVVEYSVSRSLGKEEQWPYSQLAVAFQRPNKLFVAYADAVAGAEGRTEYKIACNGEIVRSSANEVPLQIHEAIAPITLTSDNFVPDPDLRRELLRFSIENIYPQIAMLLAEDLDRPIFPNDTQERLIDDAELDGRKCYRVRMVSPAGKRVLWIDKQDYLLRKMELPIDSQRKEIDPAEERSQLSVCLIFQDVTLDADIQEDSFEMAIPEGGRRVRRFIAPPPPAPSDADEKALAEHQKYVQEYEEALDAATIRDSVLEVKVAPPEVGPRKEPETWKLEQLWQTSANDVAHPGYVLLPTGTEQILVLDGGQAIVELDAAGKKLARHELPDTPEQANGFLRMAVDGEGKPWYLASGVGWQQVYLFDAAWKNILSFPDERHAGIADVLLADLTASGKPLMHIGYWGGLGIQGGTVDGRRLWSNRSLDHVVQITQGLPDEEGKPTLWCTGTTGMITQLSAKGRPLGELSVAGYALMHVSRHPDGKSCCGIAIRQLGQYNAVGFTSDGKLLWEYPLPPGEYAYQIPRIQSLELPGGGPGWLVTAANGTLHWLDTEGKLQERFDYGQLITGAAVRNGKNGMLLYVSTPEDLTAWSLQP